MQQTLVTRAIKDIWCNPFQDTQAWIEPMRISNPSGATNFFTIFGRSLTLPWRSKRCHIFQVGQLSPGFLNLIDRAPTWQVEKWYTLTEAMNERNVYANVYNDEGVHISRTNTMFMWTKEKALIFAVLHDDRFDVDAGRERIYIRLFSNAYFRQPYAGTGIVSKAYDPISNAQITAIQTEANIQASVTGMLECFVNGYQVHTLNLTTMKVGDHVEWIHDPSVKELVIWKLRDLKSFFSKLDSEFKFILHWPAGGDEAIYHHLSNDISVSTPRDGVTWKGRYYHRNELNSIRQLTHRDYSLNASYIDRVATALRNSLDRQSDDLLDYDIRLKVRYGGEKKKLVWEANHIRELYLLDEQSLVGAMTGLNSNVQNWTAAHLEKSEYVKIMSSERKNVDVRLAQDAYGYNAITQIIGTSPQKPRVSNALRLVTLAPALVNNATVYEYNQRGYLTGTYFHQDLGDYDCRGADTYLVEPIMGKSGIAPSAIFGQNNLVIPPNVDFRVYRCWLDEPTKPNEDWEDVTGTNLYTVVDGVLKWNETTTTHFLMVRTNERFIAYTKNVTHYNGNFLILLEEELDYGLGDGPQMRPMKVQPGDLQVWINGRNLVNKIGYIVKFPYLCIISQEEFTQPATVAQNLHIRMTGVACKTGEMYSPRETGFVQHGALSNNGRYNCRKDRATHISVGGGVFHQSDLKFFEDITAGDPTNPINGQPFQICDQIVPVRDYVVGVDAAGGLEMTDKLYFKAKDTDKVVEDYLTLYLGDRDFGISPIPSRYRVISPFFALLTQLMVSGQMVYDDLKVLSDAEVRAICKPYESLLEFDPISEANRLDPNFTIVTPHRENAPIQLSRGQLRFLYSAVELYGQGLVNLSTMYSFYVTK